MMLFSRVGAMLMLVLSGSVPGSEGFAGLLCAVCRSSGSAARTGYGPLTEAKSVRARRTRPVRDVASSGELKAISAEDTSTAGSAGAASTTSSCTCRNCKEQFQRHSNVDGACSFHPGLFSGRLNRINDVDTSGLEYFWSCCGESNRSHPGCVAGRHASYDDPPEGGEGGWRSPLTGTLRSSEE